jgi:flavin reductase (DIM6/NTAB) family NADH-FMN oxidoreductase RutF
MSFKRFEIDDIDALPQRFRAAFINSVSGFKSANLIGTADATGKTNLSIVSSVLHLGSHPPLLGYVQRPPSVERHTYDNILSTKVYTINHVHRELVEKAHQTSARYLAEVSEFDAVGLTAGYRENFAAPLVEEARIRMGMRLIRDLPIEENGTRLMIGQVVWIEIPDEVLAEDGYVDLEAAGTVTISGLDAYHSTQRLARLPYAKV